MSISIVVQICHMKRIYMKYVLDVVECTCIVNTFIVLNVDKFSTIESKKVLKATRQTKKYIIFPNREREYGFGFRSIYPGPTACVWVCVCV